MVLCKVLEKVVCEQITNFIEKNDLLPDNQHGFRTGRSTMSAISATQREWSKNTDDKLIIHSKKRDQKFCISLPI